MLRDNIKRQDGFTLMDIIIGVLFLSVAFLATMKITTDLQRKLDQRDLQIRATSLANSMMSIVRSVNFDENFPTSNHTQAVNLGIDGSLLHDDIDDFISSPMTIANFGAAATGFVVTVNVYYVDPTTTPPNLTIPLSGTSFSNFKRIDVSVLHSELNNPVSISAIVTPNDY
jgi:Tfp pilus assembly protein PilV